MAPRSYLQYSGCKNDASTGNKFECALVPQECEDGYEFVTADNITAYDHYECNSVEAIRIGRCSNDGNCAIVAEGCETPALFRKEWIRNRHCSVKIDELYEVEEKGIPKPTYYTNCEQTRSNLPFCVVGGDECQRYGEIPQFHDERCDCSQTRTGACFNFADNSKYFCAIHADACGTQAKFVSAHDLYQMDKYNVDCRVCDSAPPGALSYGSGGDNQLMMIVYLLLLIVVFLSTTMGLMVCKRRQTAGADTTSTQEETYTTPEVTTTNDSTMPEAAPAAVSDKEIV